jgi:hypothetical protein
MIIYGKLTGLLSGLAATSSSIAGSSGTSFITLLIVIPSVIITGILATFISASAVKASSLISDLRKE